MRASDDITSQTLAHLHQVALQLRQLGEHLPPFNEVLGEENVDFVREAAADLCGTLSTLQTELQAHCEAGTAAANPLECRELRHDMRNRISVVKGFSELMMMDVDPQHTAAPALKQLSSLSDQFVTTLDSVKSGREDPSAMFAL